MARSPHPAWIVACLVVLGSVPLGAMALTEQRVPDAEPLPLRVAGLETGATFHGFWDYDSEEDATDALRMLKDAGGTWVRIDVGWAALEPANDAYSPWAVDGYDEAVDAARAEGLDVMLVLQRTPGWANGSDDYTLAPRDPDDFGDFALWLAQHFAGRVQAIEMWNEPNNPDFFRARQPGREAEEHAAMVKDAYAKIQDAGLQGPGAYTVLAGSPSHVDVDWWRQMYDAGIRESTDVVAVNPYPLPSDLPPTAKPDGTPNRMGNLTQLVELMQEEGDGDKPIWFSEFGWSSHPNPPVTEPWERGVAPEQAAQYFEQTIRLVEARYPEVQKLFWYNLSERDSDSAHTRGFGLIRRDGSPTPVLQRMKDIFGR